MLARLQSVALVGIEAIPCEVEVDVASRGFAQAAIVGLPNAVVCEYAEDLGLDPRNPVSTPAA